MSRVTKDFTFDLDLLLKDAGLVAADAAATVGGDARVLDLGASRVDGRVVVDATAVEVDSSDERYEILVQLSNSATFASGVFTAAGIVLGDADALPGADSDNGAGRYEFGFTNEWNGVVYRYMRLYTDVTGTIGTGVNYSASAVKATT